MYGLSMCMLPSVLTRVSVTNINEVHTGNHTHNNMLINIVFAYKVLCVRESGVVTMACFRP